MPRFLVAMTVAAGACVCILSSLALVGCEDHFFDEDIAQEYLAEQNFKLKDDFKIKKNKTVSFPYHYHLFILEISLRDKQSLIKQIQQAPNFELSNEQTIFTVLTQYNRKGKNLVRNYESNTQFVREYMETGKDSSGVHKYLYYTIKIDKNDNELIFEEND